MYTQRHANFPAVGADFPTAALYPRKIQFGLRLTS